MVLVWRFVAGAAGRSGLVGAGQGRRRADCGHGESNQSGAEGQGRGMMGWVPGSVERGQLTIKAALAAGQTGGW